MRKGSVNPHLWKAKEKVCPICHESFRAVKDWHNAKQKYCSKKCWAIRSPKDERKCLWCGGAFLAWKSQTKKYCSIYCRNKDYVGKRTGDSHPGWKGTRASYSAVHKWINNILGKPKKCDICGSTTKPKYEWACINHEYKRVLSDWVRLCSKCHKAFDKKENRKVG